MIGPQRHSLLGGEVLRRQYSAQAVLDRILVSIVDAFDFKIDDKPDTETIPASRKRACSIPASLGDAYLSYKEKEATSNTSSYKIEKFEMPSWSFGAKKPAATSPTLHEKMCSWLLAASPNGEKSNPLELGWASATQKKQQQTNQQEACVSVDELMFHGDGEDDLPSECSYAIMTC